MSEILLFPDISPNIVKDIESKYLVNDKNYLVKIAANTIVQNIKKFINPDSKILFICGKGNNGLDGIYAASLLKNSGVDIKVSLIDDNHFKENNYYHELQNYIVDSFDIHEYNIIVDCIFGNGLNRELSKDIQSIISEINKSDAFIISIDVPSGLNPITGSLCPSSVNCDLLITFMNIKRGLFTNHGRDTWKSIVFDPLIDDDIDSKNYLATANNSYRFQNKNKDHFITLNLSNDTKNSRHKKSNGVSLLIAGEPPYHGSMYLSALSSMRTGCRYMTVLTHDEYSHSLSYLIPEIVTMPHSLEYLRDNINNFKNILIGPGMSSRLTFEYIKVIFDSLDSINSVVLDAGALHFLDSIDIQSDKIILTPHPGEASLILKTDTSYVQANRYNAAYEISKKYGCKVVLKGSGTIIYNGKSFYTCMDGNYRMAVAGMGDVLSGILLSELSTSNNIDDACLRAVIYHSYSSDYLLQKGIKNYMPSMIADTYFDLIMK